MSNILQTYPGHNIHHFFGDKCMSAAQFFVLHGQIEYESKLREKQSKQSNKGSKKGWRR